MAPRKKKIEPSATPEILMLGYLCVKEIKGLPEKVSILDRFRLTDADIATICDCAIQSVRDARQKAKREGAKKNE